MLCVQNRCLLVSYSSSQTSPASSPYVTQPAAQPILLGCVDDHGCVTSWRDQGLRVSRQETRLKAFHLEISEYFVHLLYRFFPLHFQYNAVKRTAPAAKPWSWSNHILWCDHSTPLPLGDWPPCHSKVPVVCSGWYELPSENNTADSQSIT